MVALGLCCCARAFSSGSERGLLSHGGERGRLSHGGEQGLLSHCGGFSLMAVSRDFSFIVGASLSLMAVSGGFSLSHGGERGLLSHCGGFSSRGERALDSVSAAVAQAYLALCIWNLP